MIVRPGHSNPDEAFPVLRPVTALPREWQQCIPQGVPDVIQDIAQIGLLAMDQALAGVDYPLSPMAQESERNTCGMSAAFLEVTGANALSQVQQRRLLAGAAVLHVARGAASLLETQPYAPKEQWSDGTVAYANLSVISKRRAAVGRYIAGLPVHSFAMRLGAGYGERASLQVVAKTHTKGAYNFVDISTRVGQQTPSRLIRRGDQIALGSSVGIHGPSELPFVDVQLANDSGRASYWGDAMEHATF